MERNEIAEEDYSLILLSGPEPQRGIWEQQVLQQLQNTVGKIMLLSGNTSATQPIATGPNVTWHRQLTGQQLYKAIKGARLVICRSGYSSLMDLALLRKRAVVVPTPGQTEQQYLAGTLSSAGWLTAMKQDGFNLNEAIKLGLSLVHPDYVPDAFSYYRAVLKQFVSKNR
jgi:UDP-N-acetylglucosamine:LPS N-acetylglucosamine transferase